MTVCISYVGTSGIMLSEMLMTGLLCWSVTYIARVPLLEIPVSGSRPSLVEPEIFNVKIQ